MHSPEKASFVVVLDAEVAWEQLEEFALEAWAVPYDPGVFELVALETDQVGHSWDPLLAS